jgi:hypothetical protein
MRSFRRLFPRVTARRVWGLDGTPIWEFRFTSQPNLAADRAVQTPVRREPVRFVSSRGVEIGADTLRIEQFHHRIRRSVVADSTPLAPTSDQDPDNPEPSPGDPESPQVALALVDLAADPADEAAQRTVVARLAGVHTWFRAVPVLDISAALITGEGLGHTLDGLFIWRAEGGPNITYLVTPDTGTRRLLEDDPDLVRALIRAACPNPDDALGELEISLREALTRVGVVDREPHRRSRRAPAAELVMRVHPDPAERSESVEPLADREKSDSERALSEELAELALKVGTASVRKPSVDPSRRALEAG